MKGRLHVWNGLRTPGIKANRYYIHIWGTYTNLEDLNTKLIQYHVPPEIFYVIT